jgi:hypothetical protein
MAGEETKSGGAPAAAIRTYPGGSPFTGVIGRAVPIELRILTLRTSRNFSQTCLSLPVTKDGCPIQARFWLEWDSTDLDR